MAPEQVSYHLYSPWLPLNHPGNLSLLRMLPIAPLPGVVNYNSQDSLGGSLKRLAIVSHGCGQQSLHMFLTTLYSSLCYNVKRLDVFVGVGLNVLPGSVPSWWLYGFWKRERERFWKSERGSSSMDVAWHIPLLGKLEVMGCHGNQIIG